MMLGKRWLAGAVLAGLLGGCASAPVVVVPALPEVRVAMHGSEPWIKGRYELLAELSLVLPSTPLIEFDDEEYFLPQRQWVEEMAVWIRSFLAAQMPPDALEEFFTHHTSELAMLTEVFAEIDLMGTHFHKGQSAVGVMGASSQRPWGVIPGDGDRRVYLLAGTPEGFVVINVPTGQVTELRDFPNREHVSFVDF